MKNASEIRSALIGPIPTIRTPFTREGAIDYASLRNMLEFKLAAGAKTVALTGGDSHLIALSDQEIAELTKAVVEHVKGRAMVVAADRYYDTKQAVAFAKYAAGIGADVLMVLPPDWSGSNTPETLAAHYAAVAEHIPVMLVTNLFIPRGTPFGLETVRRALDLSPNIVSIKDDMGSDFIRKVALMASDRCAIWAGGLKQNHIHMAPYGGVGYLSTWLTFRPEIAWKYWNAWKAGDISTATGVIKEHEIPFFDYVRGKPGNFDAGIHAMLELAGLAKRWRPHPYHSYSDEEMERFRDYVKTNKLL